MSQKLLESGKKNQNLGLNVLVAGGWYHGGWCAPARGPRPSDRATRHRSHGHGGRAPRRAVSPDTTTHNNNNININIENLDMDENCKISSQVMVFSRWQLVH